MNAFMRSNQQNSIKNVALSLIGINVLVFILQSIFPIITETFLLTPSQVLYQPWTLITSIFLHGNLTHLLFNMYALLLFGGLIEALIGSKRFLGAYFISGIIAGIIYTAFQYTFGNPNIGALGASGAIMAVIGLVIVLLPNMKILFFFVIPMSMRTAGIIFALIDFVGLLGVTATGIAHSAHLGGLLCGVLFGIYLKKKKLLSRTMFGFANGAGATNKSSSSFTNSSYNSSKSSSKKKPFIFKKKSPSQQQSNIAGNQYEKTIELTKDDLDDYFKFGKV
jgi:uncharacterized protein